MSADSPDVTDEVAPAQTPDSLIPLAQAFDLAWARFAEAEGPGAQTEDTRRRLAMLLVTLSRAGENDLDALAEAGALHLRAYMAGMRLSQADRSLPEAVPGAPFEAAGASFGPDALDAMHAALELCLADLPLRMPSGARDLLAAEIMRQATDGERDPEKLRAGAMRALQMRR